MVSGQGGVNLLNVTSNLEAVSLRTQPCTAWCSGRSEGRYDPRRFTPRNDSLIKPFRITRKGCHGRDRLRRSLPSSYF